MANTTLSPGSNEDAQSAPTHSIPLAETEKVDNAKEEEEERDPDEKDLLHGTKLILAFVAMMFSLFLVALDVVSCYYFVPHC
jgi:hypothetical protein